MRFNLVDRITSYEKNRWIRGIKTPSFEEVNLKRPVPYRKTYPRILLAETLGQLASRLIQYSTDFKYTCVLGLLKNFTWLDDVYAGDRIELYVEIVSMHEDSALMKGFASRDGSTIAEFQEAIGSFIEIDTIADVEITRLEFNSLAGQYEINYEQ